VLAPQCATPARQQRANSSETACISISCMGYILSRSVTPEHMWPGTPNIMISAWATAREPGCGTKWPEAFGIVRSTPLKWRPSARACPWPSGGPSLQGARAFSVSMSSMSVSDKRRRGAGGGAADVHHAAAGGGRSQLPDSALNKRDLISGRVRTMSDVGYFPPNAQIPASSPRP
jgi:hypothetical protein